MGARVGVWGDMTCALTVRGVRVEKMGKGLVEARGFNKPLVIGFDVTFA